MRGLNLQFNIQPRPAIFSPNEARYSTGFLGEVFESAATDKMTGSDSADNSADNLKLVRTLTVHRTRFPTQVQSTVGPAGHARSAGTAGKNCDLLLSLESV